MTTRARTAFAASVLAAGCFLAACGGGGGSGASDDAGAATGSTAPAPPSGPPSAPPSGEDPAPDEESPVPGGGADGAAGTLKGTWTGTTGGTEVVLSISSGKAALVAGGHVCQGEASGAAEVRLVLECTGGDTTRTAGAAESGADGKLVITWDGGEKDTLARKDVGRAPTEPPKAPAP
ncbi:hypothetical protein [Streptomyces nitrosporeus]|uniref:Serine/threonine protein kinase n=1 Tax=Streptomyces nitrosporeus TaxID=28894 RepID=A0A5J6FBY9_9ACTN|nr:hypothetical protein [Streptomyces nitrosporeus]QEU73782.1 hypothetical protein CP967_18890 [Streptomyces nitrosporeus]GGZ23502.1 hypothetical protein GCM10010327_62980 [Streptomyces nitrosporeus]